MMQRWFTVLLHSEMAEDEIILGLVHAENSSDALAEAFRRGVNTVPSANATHRVEISANELAQRLFNTNVHVEDAHFSVRECETSDIIHILMESPALKNASVGEHRRLWDGLHAKFGEYFNV